MGLEPNSPPTQIPDRVEWEKLVRTIADRVETRPDFFVEIERGLLADDDPLTGCALEDFSNLQILPEGRAYRCGMLVDQEGMASLAMTGDQLRLTRPDWGRAAQVIDAARVRHVPSSASRRQARVHLRQGQLGLSSVHEEAGRARTRGLVIFDAFNTLVTSRPGYQETFLTGLTAVSEHASADLLTTLHAASEGLDHSGWSTSRRVYSEWTAGTLASLAQAGAGWTRNWRRVSSRPWSSCIRRRWLPCRRPRIAWRCSRVRGSTSRCAPTGAGT